MTILVEEAGLPAGPVQSVEDALYNEQTEARGMVSEVEVEDRSMPVIEHPINYGRAASGFERPAPNLGEHTREVFRELGYSDSTLDDLEEDGVFGE